MPQDPNLYGQRPAKRQKKEIPLSSSLDFASQLTSLLSTSTSTSDPSSSVAASSSTAAFGRPRPNKNKDDIFSVKAKRKAAAPTDKDGSNSGAAGGAKLQLKDVRGTEDEKHDLARARRKMEEKARLYAAMKRGDYIAKEGEAAPLVDFDRKWAERHPEGENNNTNNAYSSSGTDNDDDDDEVDQEMVEYKDEFGRTRRATRAEVARLDRRRQRMALGAAELESMAAKPVKAPERLIFGDVIQSGAFNPEDDTLSKMADLAAKRDKSPTPPPDTHFDGRAEIRTKGVGFYQFSQEAEVRRGQMEELERERERTERARREREEQKDRRRREIEERRKKIGERRAEKLAESFLDGLAGEMSASSTGVEGEGKGQEKGKGKESEGKEQGDADS
ncbi:uncharacterized protein F4812DRAFT_410446 [Daldinia caldariorum]|uniref:uncharacterized protein n=1 Tax=Daldinia caldariorum TaxID=326644 RepID=UPI002008D326|nr:uncharacterized protein F4812DRAFT_410446 [Daldinia caldariorum]KAI1472836.1 hypothetical protein F4812DRAFT_410446 [Daldinia caldariorum]